jgi:phage tail sheath protein FI
MLAIPDILIRPEAPPPFLPPAQQDDPCPVCPPPPVAATPATPTFTEELPPTFSDREILAVQAAMLQQCEALRDRVALLDAPWDAAAASSGPDPVLDWRNNFDSEFGALYFPWLTAPDPLRLAPTRPLPACGHIAGLIAATDLAIGVHKAPANAGLAWVQDVTVHVDPDAHGVLNTAGINAILGANGRPIRVMGARTVSSDPNFRFLNVRRLLCMVRRALELCSRWVVFEPNSPRTRASLTATISRFLNQLWKQGALVGASAAAAFQVVCDDSNNKAATQVLGELFVDIGIAPVVPFEFVLLRLGRSTDSLDIQERGVVAAGSG